MFVTSVSIILSALNNYLSWTLIHLSLSGPITRPNIFSLHSRLSPSQSLSRPIPVQFSSSQSPAFFPAQRFASQSPAFRTQRKPGKQLIRQLILANTLPSISTSKEKKAEKPTLFIFLLGEKDLYGKINDGAVKNKSRMEMTGKRNSDPIIKENSDISLFLLLEIFSLGYS